jgi:hypothetical protein
MELLELCYDVLILILEEVNAEDLAACARTCKAFNDFIKDNRLLYKAHYLRNFDDPRLLPSDPEPRWDLELQKLVKWQKTLAPRNLELKLDNFGFLAEIADDLVKRSSPEPNQSKNIAELVHRLSDRQNCDALLFRSSFYRQAGTTLQVPAKDVNEQQLSAKLHCLYGAPLSVEGRRSFSSHPIARSRVYDLRNYTEKTRWGPFRKDGSMKADWEMIEAIMIVLSCNSNLCCDRYRLLKPVWGEPFVGIRRNTVIQEYSPSLLIEPDIPLDMKDPYDVTGSWIRIVCFLDYQYFYRFNFGVAADTIPEDQPREPISPQEAIRHIIMHLKVVKVETPGQEDNQALPVVHFTGDSHILNAFWDPNTNSKLRGTVRLTREGEVHWTSVSIFHNGETRWLSEGIQVGGPRSKRGVIGTWFDSDYDAAGPVGPTAYWKTTDKQLVGKDSYDGDLEESSDEDGDEDEEEEEIYVVISEDEEVMDDDAEV